MSESVASARANLLAARAQLCRAKLATCHAAAPDEPLAHIAVDLLPDGRVRITSTCMGKPDASYAPLADARLGSEVQALVAELRERLEGVRSV